MTQTEIISNAITLLGKGVVTSLLNPVPMTTAALQAYNLYFPLIITMHNWRFSTKIVSLVNQSANNSITGFSAINNTLTVATALNSGVIYSATFTTANTLPATTPQISTNTTYYIAPLTTTTIRLYPTAVDAQANTNIITIQSAGVGAVVNVGPIGGYWQYIYTVPVDFLKLIHVYPQNYEYEVYDKQQIFSNFNNSSQPLYLEYQYLPDITLCPIYFCLALINFIASYLSLSSAQNVQYANFLKGEADNFVERAKATDTQDRPQTPLQNAPALTNRFVSTYASG